MNCWRDREVKDGADCGLERQSCPGRSVGWLAFAELPVTVGSA
jgi:hypothetical protein